MLQTATTSLELNNPGQVMGKPASFLPCTLFSMADCSTPAVPFSNRWP